MSMSSNGLLSIRKFSKLAGVKTSSLRYYDELGLFPPHHRSASHYRYYFPQQITAIKAIAMLQDMGVPVKEIAQLSQTRSPKTVLHAIEHHKAALEEQADELARRLGILRTYEELICTATAVDTDAIEVRHMDAHPITPGPPTHFSSLPGDFTTEFVDFCLQASELGIDLAYPIGGLFEDFEGFAKDPNRPNHFFSYGIDGSQMKPEGDYLVAYHRGYYGQAKGLPERVRAYIDEHHLTLTGPVYNLFVLDGIAVSKPDDYLLQFSVRVA
jgi:DNA-binding transcriptional MerR regulator